MTAKSLLEFEREGKFLEKEKKYIHNIQSKLEKYKKEMPKTEKNEEYLKFCASLIQHIIYNFNDRVYEDNKEIDAVMKELGINYD